MEQVEIHALRPVCCTKLDYLGEIDGRTDNNGVELAVRLEG